ncbi:MAG TPA: hypothetical protein VGO93_16815 [Candidatus Xenobia bacterium]
MDAFDAGQCVAYMQLAAWELSIASGIGSFADPEKARAILRFPAEWKLAVCHLAMPPTPGPRPGRRPPTTGQTGALERLVI